METYRNIALKVENLKTQFQVGKRIVHAVNGVSFELKYGKTLGIVGESGCGKSVTALSIMQLLPRAGSIESGEITYKDRAGNEYILSKQKKNGRDIRAIRGKEIAMIFQDPMLSLNPVYKIGKQVAENLNEHEKLNKKDAKKRVVEMLAELGIPTPDKRYDDYPHQFSGGMRQRVMIATAMICNPNILIADEPTTALDVTIQAQILELMKEIQKKHGTSIILITHNMGIIAESCDEVAVMYMGHIVEFGNVEQILSKPMHPYTKALMRSVPVISKGEMGELVSIRGVTPDASEVFVGCEFEPRCDFSSERCKKEPPYNTVLEGNHHVRCWLYSGGKDNV